jgi:hypothetical protein
MPIHKVVIKTSLFGRSNRGPSNTFYFYTQDVFNSPNMIATTNQLVARLRAAATDQVHFMSSGIKAILNDDNTLASGKTRPIELAGTGARVLAPGDDLAGGSYALTIGRETNESPYGHIRLRGYLKMSDFPPFQGTSGDPPADPAFQTLADALSAAYTNAVPVLPASSTAVGEPYRSIYSHWVGPVRLFQLSAIRESIERDEVKLAQRKINQFAAAIRKLYRANGGAPLDGNLLLTAKNIAQTALNFYNALTVLLRAKVSIPSILMAIIGLLA